MRKLMIVLAALFAASCGSAAKTPAPDLDLPDMTEDSAPPIVVPEAGPDMEPVDMPNWQLDGLENCEGGG